MPEGDTIWRAAAALRERLVGQQLLEGNDRLRGSRLTAVDAIGKHLVMHFDNGFALRTHMRMKGSWHIYRADEKWRKSDRTATAVLRFPQWVAVAFSVPVVELTREENVAVRHLGPDILADGFDVAEVVRRTRATQPATLGEMLLDQRICAGVGNVYKCETLWQLRRDPWLPPAELEDRALADIFSRARELMLPNLRGSFTRRFGGKTHAVHGRGGRPCPRCHTLIRVRAQGEQARLTYFCPTCQRAAI